jgi:hypothetical protein
MSCARPPGPLALAAPGLGALACAVCSVILVLGRRRGHQRGRSHVLGWLPDADVALLAVGVALLVLPARLRR